LWERKFPIAVATRTYKQLGPPIVCGSNMLQLFFQKLVYLDSITINDERGTAFDPCFCV